MRSGVPTTLPEVLCRPAKGRRWEGCQGLFLWLTIFGLSATTVAQQGTKDLSDASLEELSNIQVYSASKHMQSASEAPASVTVVTADEIQKYGYRNLADILRSVPGFYVTYDRDYTFVGVRGFGRLGDWNSRILVLIDGHRINNNVLGQAMLGNEFLVDVDMIERVEIVCGPSSSLYGANAFFAVDQRLHPYSERSEGLGTFFSGRKLWHLRRPSDLRSSIARPRRASLRHVLQQPGPDFIFSAIR